ncbi:MAG: pyruvate dehydrogenase (acetyl-transferring) E1 component subunit alpha [Bacteroidota bacterium]|nr:pyruvate dehydrogenase (acetyl-transferring) E1 component subunit alpha [Bacteroidota bacterium]
MAITNTKDITTKYTNGQVIETIQKLSDKDKLYQKWYSDMVLMRKFEEKAGQMYGMQKIRGFCHLYIGQEAVTAGMRSAMVEGDKVITAYRDHAHAIIMGIPAKEVMAELYGKATGCTKGKGGSMHLFSKEKNFFGGHGIVGAQIPMGAGIAFADKYLNKENVTYVFMGDGAARQGALHETFTMAMLWKLPVVFVCENNKYGMGTAVERTTNVPELYRMGAAYDMPSYPVDGMSVEACHLAFADARASAINGTPVFLEMNTYRYKGHSMSDPAKYRTREELDSFRITRDPIEVTEKYILSNKIANQEWIDKVNEDVKAVVEEAVVFAEESPYPDPSEIYTDNYLQEDYPFLKD